MAKNIISHLERIRSPNLELINDFGNLHSSQNENKIKILTEISVESRVVIGHCITMILVL